MARNLSIWTIWKWSSNQCQKFKDLCTSTEYGTYCEEKFQKIVPRFGIKAGKTDYESVDEIDLYVPELKHRFVSSGNHNNYTSRPTDIAFEQELHNATLLTNGKQSLPPRGSSALESRHQLQPGTGLFVPGYKVVNKSQLATSGMKTPGQNILYSKRSRPTSSDSSRTDRSITSNSTGKMSTFSDSDSITSISTESSSSSLSSLAPLPVPKLKNQSKPYGYQNEITDTFPNYHMSVRPYTPQVTYILIVQSYHKDVTTILESILCKLHTFLGRIQQTPL